jgi:hypothetical protein
MPSPPRPVVQFTEPQDLELVVVPDYTRFLNDRGDVRDPSQNMGDAKHLAEGFDALDAVLKRDDGCVIGQQRQTLFGSRLGVVGLDHEQDHVDRAEFFRQIGGVVGRDRSRQMDVAGFRQDLQAVRADGVQVAPTGDESHLMAGLGQFGAKIATNSARTHDGDFQSHLVVLPLRF